MMEVKDSKYGSYSFIFSSPPIRIAQTIALAMGFLLISFLFPLRAHSDCNVGGDIPFTMLQNDSDTGVCIQCDGPWGRTSGLVEIKEGTQNCTFYAAAINMFSPYDLWTCELMLLLTNEDGSQQCGSRTIEENSFCLQYIPGGSFVDIDIASDLRLIFNMPPPNQGDFCKPTATAGFLGDNFKHEKSKPDRDVFLFNGAGGDEIKLALEADPQAGNNGGNASLGVSGNSLNEATSGTPALEISTTLPADGEYSIIVEQPRIPENQRFRGSYILRLESSAGAGLIKPTNKVEN